MKTAQIVLIEDNPADVLLVKLALKEAGIAFALRHFEMGDAAATALCEPENTDSPAPDLILMDLNTPRSDGFAILSRLTASCYLSGVPIVLMSTTLSGSDKKRAQSHGARYVVKPEQLRDFLSIVGSIVREMLDGAKSDVQEQGLKPLRGDLY